ncbi:hypothetical protein G6L26_007355 [Agrobacterium radiobacter]|uniref:Uncharacterized protein n=1 Tax=Agrobacterium tumefaciens str. B6 TaxID=1183423 RepID=A0A822UY00_AGRTU|nr:hypothetical protein [Agrobacterium tumefaciens]KWT87999.1 hypothetical protein ASB65_18355 [Agrobacterium tumefaciens str. B6]MQB28207.1 hypothetical protein [Agrobacterium tumefaciens]NTA04988.1 hypothetical protein [Agrobacterium tumefaciens]NTA91583.1 hypothetical protein [Agrobacterium tumefaciens]NTB12733.1 hypothetical protein [Agrobacterium tumefaciens]
MHQEREYEDTNSLKVLAVDVATTLMPHLKVIASDNLSVELEVSEFKMVGSLSTTSSVKITVSATEQ